MTTASEAAPKAAAGAATLVLFTLASGQFLMTLDSSVMNVSIATVAKDVGTTVTGIQGAITAYTLVMASLMITGAKIGALIGRKRAFAVGCLIYGAGSFTTAISPSLPVLLFGWSLLEGIGAALILPAIVALVAGNFPKERRPAAYGLVAAAGAVAVAVGPLIGGFCTTYFSWRWVFAGEVVVVLVILALTRRIADAPVEERPSLDLVGTLLSAAGLGLLVFGVLRSSEWGWFQPKPDGPSWAGFSPTIWLILMGIFVLRIFSRWEVRRVGMGKEPLVRPGFLRNRQLSGGLLMFFFQFLVQAGVFFVVPLFLSVCLGLSALATGARLLPLSVTLLVAAIGIPRFLPNVSPRLIVRIGLFSLLAGTVVLMAGLDVDAGPEVVFVPMLLLGLGIGALASQLGSVTVSAVPDEDSPEVGGVQNTMTNLGASLGTALAGSVMIAAVAASFLTNIQQNPAIPAEVKSQAQVELTGGVPFISDADLEQALDQAGVDQQTSEAALGDYQEARIDGLKDGLAILALLALIAQFFVQRIPTSQPGRAPAATS
ncbi:MAG TPA: MFS transporter [Gaiellaceae bacterium]|nr:MFS transporter [Gaiellaceae bacterium]HET8651423.1 MFS transporter [Gaiellaceae bacterium]